MKTWYLNVSTRVLDACTIIGCLNPCSYADWDNLQVYFVNDRLHVWCKTRCRMHSIAWADTVMCRVSSRVVMCRQGSHSPLSPKCEIIPAAAVLSVRAWSPSLFGYRCGCWSWDGVNQQFNIHNSARTSVFHHQAGTRASPSPLIHGGMRDSEEHYLHDSKIVNAQWTIHVSLYVKRCI